MSCSYEDITICFYKISNSEKKKKHLAYGKHIDPLLPRPIFNQKFLEKLFFIIQLWGKKMFGICKQRYTLYKHPEKILVFDCSTSNNYLIKNCLYKVKWLNHSQCYNMHRMDTILTKCCNYFWYHLFLEHIFTIN